MKVLVVLAWVWGSKGLSREDTASISWTPPRSVMKTIDREGARGLMSRTGKV